MVDTEQYDDPQSPYTRRYTYYVIFILFLVSVVNYMDRMALAILIPSIKKDLHISDSELGLLLGFAFFLFYAVCGIPIARWADRGARKTIVALALSVWSLMTALSGGAQNFWHLLVARVGVGAGEAGSIAPSQSMICDYVPLAKRTGVFAFHNLGLSTGMMVGLVLAGWLGEAVGWRWTFVCLGLPGLVLAVVVHRTIREPIRGTFDIKMPRDNERISSAAALRLLRACGTYRWLLLFAVLQGFALYGLNQWWPSFYERVFGLKLAAVGAYLGPAIGAGSAAGVLIGGLVGNRLARRDVRLPLLFSASTTILALPSGIACLFLSSIQASIAFVLLTAAFLGVSNGPLIAALYSVSAPNIRATAGALMIGISSVFGYGLGPLCVGAISDALMPIYGYESLRYALLAPLCVLPPMTVALFIAAMKLKADVSQVVVDGTVQSDVLAREVPTGESMRSVTS